MTSATKRTKRTKTAQPPQPDALVCARKFCRTTLVEHHDHQLGRITWTCPACERFKAGLCRDCDAKRAGTSPRCTTCKKAHLRKRARTIKRQRYHHEPEFRARQLAANARCYANHTDDRAAYWRIYSAAHPRTTDALDRAYKRAWAASPKGQAHREKWNTIRRQRTIDRHAALAAASASAAPAAHVTQDVAAD